MVELALFSYFRMAWIGAPGKSNVSKSESGCLANGLIVAMYGSTEGRRHDVALLRQSSISRQMRAELDGFVLYDDSAYPITKWLVRLFQGANFSQPQQLFNRKMSSARICVEWCLGTSYAIGHFSLTERTSKSLCLL